MKQSISIAVTSVSRTNPYIQSQTIWIFHKRLIFCSSLPYTLPLRFPAWFVVTCYRLLCQTPTPPYLCLWETGWKPPDGPHREWQQRIKQLKSPDRWKQPVREKRQRYINIYKILLVFATPRWIGGLVEIFTSRAGVDSSTWVDWVTSAAWRLLW